MRKSPFLDHNKCFEIYFTQNLETSDKARDDWFYVKGDLKHGILSIDEVYVYVPGFDTWEEMRALRLLPKTTKMVMEALSLEMSEMYA